MFCTEQICQPKFYPQKIERICRICDIMKLSILLTLKIGAMMDDCYLSLKLRVLQNVQEYQMILTLKPGAMMDALTPETPAAPAPSRGQLILFC